VRTSFDGAGLRRVRGDRDQRVTFIELFFDLVFVFAVTQLSHSLLEHLSLRGALQTLLLLLPVWRAWIDTAWITSWFDPDRRPIRVMLIGVMLVSLLCRRCCRRRSTSAVSPLPAPTSRCKLAAPCS
jgi:low temperature requirement protein LtrA